MVLHLSRTIDAVCDGCAACTRRCPEGAITGARGTVHHIDRRLCIDCEACGVICPRGAVRDALGRPIVPVAPRQRARPVIDEDLCNGCALCVKLCSFGCLAPTGTPFYSTVRLALPRACVSCGECARFCIKGAIQMRAAS